MYRACMEIPVQPQHPRTLCRHGTPSPLTPLKTTTLLTHVHLLGVVWNYPRTRTYEKKNTKINSEGFKAICTKICSFQNFPLYGTCGYYIITPHVHDTLHPMYYVPVNVSERMDVTHPTLWCCNKMQLPMHYKPVHSLQVLAERPLFWWGTCVNSVRVSPFWLSVVHTMIYVNFIIWIACGVHSQFLMAFTCSAIPLCQSKQRLFCVLCYYRDIIFI